VSFAAITFSASAALVGPGQTVSDNLSDQGYQPPGVVIAEQTISHTFNYTPIPKLEGQTFPDPPVHTFEAVNRVYRADDGHLTFSLDSKVEYGEAFLEGWTVGTGNYDSFITDVHTTTGEVSASRDDVGKLTITAGNQASVFPRFFIETNATSFNGNGFADISGREEFALTDSGGNPGLFFATAEGSLGGLFQPVSESGPVAVPLPPAVYGGLGMLMLIGGWHLRRRNGTL
jgi:hypothetical protein